MPTPRSLVIRRCAGAGLDFLVAAGLGHLFARLCFPPSAPHFESIFQFFVIGVPVAAATGGVVWVLFERREGKLQVLGSLASAAGVGYGVATYSSGSLRIAPESAIVAAIIAIVAMFFARWTVRVLAALANERWPLPDPEVGEECANCGYSRRGLTTPRCPECGVPITNLPVLGLSERPEERNHGRDL